MPNFDGTGPQGQGPLTGRGMGKCAGAKGGGLGRGMGRRAGRGCIYNNVSVDDEKKLLQADIKAMQDRLQELGK
ncbi:MAG: DUF5320 domain-containing protein [Candidatus Gracilibacteria bacterium]|nr:DUF5320 domain-containing protein [Candidatus Gracilibacteria bacterium]